MKPSPLLLSLILLLAGCRAKTDWKDNEIDPALRTRINQLDKQVIEGFATRNPGLVLRVCSKELAAKAENDVYSLILATGGRLQQEKFHIKNQFYVKNPDEGAVSNTGTGNKGDHDYTLTFTSVTREAFVTVGYFEDSLQSLALTTIWGKYGNDWQLNIMRIGTMDIMRRDAVDWYGKAREYYGSGDLADAANALSIGTVALQPATGYWHYGKEQEINDFGAQVKAAAKKQFTFPLTVTGVSSAPRIFQVSPEITGSGFVPMVLYTSALSQNDTAALSGECSAIHAQIGRLFQGLDRNNKWILYRAYERIPAGGRDTVRNHGFVRAAQG